MTIRAVFFDMGGTIETYGWTPELRIQETAGIRQRLEEAGIPLGLTDKQLYEIISAGLDEYHRVSLQTMDELPPQRVLNEYIFAGLHVDRDRLAAIAEDLMVFLETRWFQRAMRPEVPAVLQAIHKMGLKIGLISNVNSRGQVPANLELYGIRHYFDPIILSSEYGRRKPDPAIFHYAARLANVPTGECVYIGDRISRDILGARKAGYRLAVQIRHDYEHGEVDEGATPDAVIDEMNEILEILRVELNNSKDSAPGKNSQNPIRALLFDAGDILYYRPYGDRNLRSFLSELGMGDKEIPEAKKKKYRDQAFTGAISQSQYRQACLREYGVTEPGLVERGSRAMDEDDNGIQFFKGVRETLKSLKAKGYLLGIITDTANPIHIKLSWFERGGFENVWDSIISSHEVGVEKPDPRIYLAALKQLGLSPRQVVFVGHSPEELDGARALGMKTIAFNYEISTQADYYIDRFQDLLIVETDIMEDQPA
jgi:putative hydrolase of the HAD superfamily